MTGPNEYPDGRNGKMTRYQAGGPPAFVYSAPPGSAPAGDDDVLELSDALAMLRRRWWLVVLGAALGVVAAFLIREQHVVTYTASAVVQVEDRGSQAAAGELFGIRSSDEAISSRLELLRSTQFLTAAVRHGSLEVRPLSGNGHSPHPSTVVVREEVAAADTLEVTFRPNEFSVRSVREGQLRLHGYGEPASVGPVTLTFQEPPGVAEAQYLLRPTSSAASSLRGALTTSRRSDTNVVDLRVTDRDPGFAQRAVNALAEVFTDLSAEDARGESTRRIRFLEARVQETEAELRQAQAELTGFRQRERVVSATALGTADQSRLVQIEVRQEELRADRELVGQVVDRLGTDPDSVRIEEFQGVVALPAIAENPVVTDFFGQLREAMDERESATAGPWSLSGENPDVQALDRRISRLKERLDSALRSHLENLDVRLRGLETLVEQTSERIAVRPEAQAEESRLLAEVDAVGTTASFLREQLFLARVQAAAEGGPVRVIDLAPGASANTLTGWVVILALGTLLGTLLGMGGAIGIELLNTKVRRTEDMETALGVATLGVIPRLPHTVGGLPGNRVRIRAKRTRAGVGQGSGNDSGGGTATIPALAEPGLELVAYHRARSSQAESFRTLRTNLLYSAGPDGERPKVLVVASALPREGKTTTAANLAVTYAQQGLKVLLVDCDVRRPRLNNLFGITRKPGLTELLMGEAGADECIRPYGPIENLDLFPAGHIPPNPTELLGGNRTREVLGHLRDHYDMILLDTAPLAGGADAAILGAAADGVVMVVLAGDTERGALEDARRQLHTVGVRVVGAVLNDPGGETERYGSYYYKYYQYNYGARS